MTRHVKVGLLVMLAVLAALPIAKAHAAPVYKLTLSGPATAAAGARTFTGTLTRTPTGGTSGITITLLVDGVQKGAARTSGAGAFTKSINLPDTNPHKLQAIAFLGAANETRSPVFVVNANVVAIAAGGAHTCALVSFGTVRCWGDNGSGALGDGTRVSRNTPVPVVGLSNVIAIAAGMYHSCALLSGGSVKCWGYNEGRLGDGTPIDRAKPVVVPGLSGVTAIAAGEGHTCAVVAGGALKCWGDNRTGALGTGDKDTRYVPADVQGITGATQVSAGEGSTCARVPKSQGYIRCWGDNRKGQLGDGTTTSTTTSVAVRGMTNGLAFGTSVTSGAAHSCARTGDGFAKCWGANDVGQLGNGTTSSGATPPTAVTGTNALSISAGLANSCVVAMDRTAKCWGSNFHGAVGNGSYGDRNSPTPVFDLAEVSAISVGGSHVCAILSSGTAKCWGANYQGQLGTGDTTGAIVPKTVVGT